MSIQFDIVTVTGLLILAVIFVLVVLWLLETESNEYLKRKRWKWE